MASQRLVFLKGAVSPVEWWKDGWIWLNVGVGAGALAIGIWVATRRS